LPLRDLFDLRSRPFEEDERWFPCKMSEWVILSDDFYGRIVEQTPEIVTIETMRGTWKTYPTADFLKLAPRNLSCNVFPVVKRLGIDYSHRNEVNGDIVKQLVKEFEAEIKKEFYGEHLIEVRIELEELAESSLNIITIAKFNGAVASEYFEIGWRVQQIALEACNKYGWSIPFPQLTIHQNNIVEKSKTGGVSLASAGLRGR